MINTECPIGRRDSGVVTLAHGSGGRATNRLIKEMFAVAFPYLQPDTDGAVLVSPHLSVFTTDSFVVDPVFFPGGDIGKLAVYGTVNDLSMMLASPRYLSVAFILEEGFPLADLSRIVNSMANAANECRVAVVTGDTKVVERGRGHGIYINTTGLGCPLAESPGPSRVCVGDKIILSGDIGRHGMAIMSARNGIQTEVPILSDCANLSEMVEALAYRTKPHCLRDATRGGLAAALCEIAESSGLYFIVNEEAIPVCDEVRGLCEIMGMDPLHVANEGRFVFFVDPKDEQKALSVLHSFENGKDAVTIGEVKAKRASGLVTTHTLLGSEKIIQIPEGEILPRIC